MDVANGPNPNARSRSLSGFLRKEMLCGNLSDLRFLLRRGQELLVRASTGTLIPETSWQQRLRTYLDRSPFLTESLEWRLKNLEKTGNRREKEAVRFAASNDMMVSAVVNQFAKNLFGGARAGEPINAALGAVASAWADILGVEEKEQRLELLGKLSLQFYRENNHPLDYYANTFWRESRSDWKNAHTG